MSEEVFGGLYAGKVVSIKDPEHRGRVKVCIAELTQGATSNWCEPCVPVCSENDGDFCLPKLKDYVWVAFLNGDLDSPVYLGGWWTPDNSPLGEDYKDPTKQRIISFMGLQIVFNSKDDSLIIEKDEDCLIKLHDDGKITLLGDVNVKGSLSVNGSKIS